MSAVPKNRLWHSHPYFRIFLKKFLIAAPADFKGAALPPGAGVVGAAVQGKK